MDITFFDNSLNPQRPFLVFSKKLNSDQDLNLRYILTTIQNLFDASTTIKAIHEEESEGEGDTDDDAEVSFGPRGAGAGATIAATGPDIVTAESHFCLLELAPIQDSGPIYLVCVNTTAAEIQDKIQPRSASMGLSFPRQGLYYDFDQSRISSISLTEALPPATEASAITFLYNTTITHPAFLTHPASDPTLSAAQCAVIKAMANAWWNFLERRFWRNYQAITPRYQAPGDDAFGFFTADPLRLLVNIICYSRATKDFFRGYIERRLRGHASLTPDTADALRLKCIEDLIKYYVLTPDQADHNTLSILRVILTEAPLDPSLAIKVVSCHYNTLLTALAEETGILLPSLPTLLQRIKDKIATHAETDAISVFKETHCKLTSEEVETGRSDFSLLFTVWEPKLDDLGLLHLLQSCLDDRSPSFFAGFFADLLTVPDTIVDSKLYFISKIPSLREQIKALVTPVLAKLPLQIFTEAMQEQASWILLIQMLEHFSSLTTTDAISSCLDHAPLGHRRPRVIDTTLANITKIIRQEYNKTLPSCLQRVFGARPLEITSSSMTLSAYGVIALDFTLDNFLNIKLMDNLMEGLFSLLFLIAAVSLLMDKIPRKVFTHYGRSPSLRKSMWDLAKTPSFIIKACGAILTGGFYAFSGYETGAPTANNDTLNLIAVIFFTLLEYLMIALTIQTFLSFVAVFAEHQAIQRQSRTQFSAGRALPAAAPTDATVVEVDMPFLSILAAGVGRDDASSLPLREFLTSDRAALAPASPASAAGGAGAGMR